MPTVLPLLLCALLALLGQSRAVGAEIRLAGPALAHMDVSRLQATAEAALARIEGLLGVELRRDVQLFVVDREELLDPEIAPHFEKWTVALANTRTGRIDVLSPRIQLEAPGDLATVLRHEFVHVLLGQLEVELSGGERHIPLWLHEGLAQFLAGQGWFPRYAEALSLRAATGGLHRFADLERRFPDDEIEVAIAYAQSLSFLQFLDRRIGLTAVLDACREWLGDERYESVDHALAYRRGESFGTLEAEWREELTGGRSLLRHLSGNCFEILVWFCVPLLLIVVYRRVRRGREIRAHMERIERLEDAMAAEPDPFAEAAEPRADPAAEDDRGRYDPRDRYGEDEDDEWPPRTR